MATRKRGAAPALPTQTVNLYMTLPPITFLLARYFSTALAINRYGVVMVIAIHFIAEVSVAIK